MWRYGANAWDELVQMRRKIAKQRQDTIYRQAELRRDLLNTVVVLLLIAISVGVIGGLVYFIADVKGWI
jgi:predicted PurR-regulated permease PerM